MSRFSRSVRIAVAGLLAVSALTVFSASPASAAATGTLTADGSGGLVVTYSGVAQNDNLDLVVQVAGTPCSTNPADEIAFLTTDSGAPPQYQLLASPASIVVGTSMFMLTNNPPGSGPLPAGTYTFCLVNNTGQPPLIVVTQLDMTLGQVPVTTTTAPTTTTTAPAADLVAPSFTG